MRSKFRLISKNAVIRKSSSFCAQIPRSIIRHRAQSYEYQQQPVVVANSFPKSGTHLLTQILGALPVRSFGTFLASTPSLTPKERSPQRMARAVMAAVPGELISAHLFHSPEVARSLEQIGAVNYFIYRDPRDVVVSEAIYLGTMNKWHHMHRIFAELSPADRIQLAIEGLQGSASSAYPDVGTRFSSYSTWLKEHRTFVIRFEDLVSNKRADAVSKIIAYYYSLSADDIDVDSVAHAALANIAPERSHTFRQGKPGAWESAFSPQHKDLFKQFAGEMLIDLGYEADLDW